MVKKKGNGLCVNIANIFQVIVLLHPVEVARPLIGKQEDVCPFCRGNEGQLEYIHDEVWEGEKLLYVF